MKHSILCSLGIGAVSLTVLTTQLAAQTSAFTYQGSLSQNGQPANGTYDFMFRLMNAPTDGAAAPVIPINPGVGVTNGLFTTGIDFGAENLNGANLWLEISVRTNGGGAFTTLGPRQLLTSAPYAVKALEAATVPQGTITSAMLADGAVTSAKIAPGAVSQLGSPDGTPLSALQINPNGLVGVGTSLPAAGLHISSQQGFQSPRIHSVLLDETAGYTNLNGACAIVASGALIATAGIDDSGITLFRAFDPTPNAQFRDGDGVFTNLAGVAGLALESSLLVAAASIDDAVTLIDVSAPHFPIKLAELRDGLGGWNALNGACAVAIAGNLVAIAASADSAVTLANIANPIAPLNLFEFKDEQSGYNGLAGARAVALSGNLLVIGAGSDHVITLVDITNPSSPIKRAELREGLAGYDAPLGSQSLAISGNLLAVASYYDDALLLWDVSDPANPTKLAELRQGLNADSLDGITSLAFSANQLAATARIDRTLTVFDVSNPVNPSMLAVARNDAGGFNDIYGSHAVAYSGNYIAVAAKAARSVTISSLETQSVGLSVGERVGIGTFLPAGALHVVGDVVVERAQRIELSADWIELGNFTTASGSSSTAMGSGTTASGESSTAMGVGTLANGSYSTAMGWATTASGDASTAMGVSTLASGHYSMSTGYDTVASGTYSFAGGLETIASGRCSTAIGFGAKALHDGTFVWGDYQFAELPSSAENEFTVRASGGVRFFSNTNLAAGVSLAPNANAWSVISDRAVKKDFAAVDSREVLEKLAAVPVQSWHYQWESADATPHLGPVAQDFKAAFYPGRDDKSITTLEFDGVALAAIQGLNRKLEDKLEQKQTEIAELQRQNAELLKRLEAVEARLR